MKKLVFLFLFSASLISCNVSDDDFNDFYFEVLPVLSVDMPSQFVFGQTYPVHVTYIRPSGCHVFNDFYYTTDINIRNIAIINTVYTNQDCELDLNEEVEVSFNFQVNSTEPYIFRFWQGEDDNGNDLYYIVEVPVIL
jgi:hypothetical protein